MPLGVATDVESLLCHLFQCIDDSKKVCLAQSAEGNEDIDLEEM